MGRVRGAAGGGGYLKFAGRRSASRRSAGAAPPRGGGAARGGALYRRTWRNDSTRARLRHRTGPGGTPAAQDVPRRPRLRAGRPPLRIIRPMPPRGDCPSPTRTSAPRRYVHSSPAERDLQNLGGTRGSAHSRVSAALLNAVPVEAPRVSGVRPPPGILPLPEPTQSTDDVLARISPSPRRANESRARR